jgi:hypothetical protein
LDLITKKRGVPLVAVKISGDDPVLRIFTGMGTESLHTNIVVLMFVWETVIVGFVSYSSGKPSKFKLLLPNTVSLNSTQKIVITILYLYCFIRDKYITTD